MKLIGKILILAAAALTFAACEPEPQPTPPHGIEPETSLPHLMVLGEGTWGGNNASLAYLDIAHGELVGGWFATQNGRGLGDVAQDILVYGSKAYVTVWGSNSLEVIDTTTGVSRRVDLGDRGPRHMAST